MKRILPLVILLIITMYCPMGVPAMAMSSSAQGMCVIDVNTGKVLYEKDKDRQLAMASTTKVVTAITVVDNVSDLDQIITVADESIGVHGTSIYLKKNEQITIRDLLYGLMLRSGNDASVALAIHTAGSVDAFSQMMNATAAKCNATNSSFKNPHGLDEPGHYTTAYDLANITAYALKNEVFKQLVSTKNYRIDSSNESEIRYLKNKNRLLDSLDGCIGVKTGYTNKAGRCLVSATQRQDFTAVCVVLNCGPMFEDSASLLSGVYDKYENKLLVDANTHLYSTPVYDSQNNLLYVFSKEKVYYPALKGTAEKEFGYEYDIDTKNSYPSGAEIGKLNISYNNHLIKSVKLYTINSIEILEKKDILNQITSDWVR